MMENNITSSASVGRAGYKFPSAGSLFAAYATASATIKLAQDAYVQLLPFPVRSRLEEICNRLLNIRSKTYYTLRVEEYHGMKRNPLYDAFDVYLRQMMTNSATYQKATNEDFRGPISLHLVCHETFIDNSFDNIKITWEFLIKQPKGGNPYKSNNRFYDDDESSDQPDGVERSFELQFLLCHKENVMTTYVPKVVDMADKLRSEDKVLRIWTRKHSKYSFEDKDAKWESLKFNHPANFDSLALDPALKETIIEDLNLFLERKEYYKSVGRAWKRGYLLYGPPGTGKSSLIASIANYLKFDVYDLQVDSTVHDSVLRKLLLSIENRSILVIEDIDCSSAPTNRRDDSDSDDDEDDSSSDDDYDDYEDEEDKKKKHKKKMHGSSATLSGLLNFVDGLWSSSGDERIFIFTKNHKEKLDPALLRPGRMDMHIHMSYLGVPAFRILVSNYLKINTTEVKDQNNDLSVLLEEIEGMLQTTNVSPAEVAEELMRSKDAKAALEGVLELLKRRKAELEAEQEKKEKARLAKKKVKEELMKQTAMPRLGIGQRSINAGRYDERGDEYCHYIYKFANKCDFLGTPKMSSTDHHFRRSPSLQNFDSLVL